MNAEPVRWRGGGRVQVAQLGGAWVSRLARVTTRGGRIQSLIREALRQEFPRHRPDNAGSHAVSIWIETPNRRRRIDIDNLAKPCLDALVGTIWCDDSQVVRLVAEKVDADGEAITVHVAPAAGPADGRDLAAQLRRVEGAMRR